MREHINDESIAIQRETEGQKEIRDITRRNGRIVV